MADSGSRPAPRSPRPRSGADVGAEAQESHLRIIAGSLRHRKLRYHGDPRTRPMKERVREAVFSVLGPTVKGTHVLDLFAGTGALGFEAISRGAARGTFFERHFPTAALLRDNAATLGVAEQCEILTANTLIQFRRPEPFRIHDPKFPWLVFCSPPYDLYIQQPEALMQLLETLQRGAPAGSWIVAEFDDRFSPDHLPDADHWALRDYSPAWVALWATPQIAPPA